MHLSLLHSALNNGLRLPFSAGFRFPFLNFTSWPLRPSWSPNLMDNSAQMTSLSLIHSITYSLLKDLLITPPQPLSPAKRGRPCICKAAGLSAREIFSLPVGGSQRTLALLLFTPLFFIFWVLKNYSLLLIRRGRKENFFLQVRVSKVSSLPVNGSHSRHHLRMPNPAYPDFLSSFPLPIRKRPP